MESDDDITATIIGCALKVHTLLGPGLLESAYQECLYHELLKSGLYVEKQVAVPLIFERVRLECAYRMDLLVERCIVIEIKSIGAFDQIHFAQLLTYLKLSHNRIGLLFNFNVLRLKEGIKRVVNG
jgi:GxxExxY protein